MVVSVSEGKRQNNTSTDNHTIFVPSRARTTTTAFDLDVLVAGHLTRTGTKEDVYTQMDYFNDVLEGVRCKHCSGRTTRY